MADRPHPLRRILRYTGAASIVLISAFLVWTLGPGAGWVLRHIDDVHGLKGKELEDALDAVRGRVLTAATGLAALVAVYFTARNAETARRTFQLGEQGQVTERYTKAIEQLGSDKLDIRLGGIYALERIATDSARDHPTIMEVLTAFVREHTVITTPDGRLAADVQAAMTVIGRRITHQDSRRLDLTGVDLVQVKLGGADLNGADLTAARLIDAGLANAKLRACLRSANLSEAGLVGADLRGADLRDATLDCADLTYANLRDADLTGADLTGVDLTGADLTEAFLVGTTLADAILVNAKVTDADMTRADLRGADLTGVDLSTVSMAGADLTGVIIMKETQAS